MALKWFIDSWVRRKIWAKTEGKKTTERAKFQPDI
jgi:hypothetical protein